MKKIVVADGKSHGPENYGAILIQIVSDVEAFAGPPVEGITLDRDKQEIAYRCVHEGLGFLTQALPRFHKHVLSCVEQGIFTPLVGFQKQRSGPLPIFLQGLVGMLFTEAGLLRTDRDSYALGYIAQICGFLYKAPFAYKPEVNECKLKDFVEIDRSLTELTELDSAGLTILDNAIHLSHKVWSQFETDSLELPKHGPGAVAGKERHFEKFNFHFSDSLDDIFPWETWFSTNSLGCACEGPPRDPLLYEKYLESGCYGPLLPSWVIPSDRLWWFKACSREYFDRRFTARVVLVQKDSRGPRLISAEPKEHQWVQQAIGRTMAIYLQKLCPLTRGRINFTDQSKNRRRALQGSLDRKWATLDMKDASDRVSLVLARLLLPSKLMRLLEACRSDWTELKPGYFVQLKKFAPMGSACCFPVESFIFWALSVACVQYETGWDLDRAAKCVNVYGDDIAIQTRFARCVMDNLSQFDLRFNTEKCFIDGPFRESCGCDAIDGIEVQPVRLRTLLPETYRDANSLVSLCETSNLLYYAGYWKAADYIASIIEEIWGPLQYVPPQSGLFGLTGRHHMLSLKGEGVRNGKKFPVRSAKWDKDLQGCSHRVTRVVNVGTRGVVGLCEPYHLLRSLVKRPVEELYWMNLFYPADGDIWFDARNAVLNLRTDWTLKRNPERVRD